MTGITGTNTYPFGSVVITLTAILGGADTSVLFDKAGVIGEDSGFTFDYTNKALTLTSITNPAASTLTLTGGTALTTSQPVLSMTQTWNNAAVAFTGLKYNITNSASASGSLYFDFQIGGNSLLSQRKDGWLRLGDQSNNNNGALTVFSNNANHGIDFNSQATGVFILGKLDVYAIASGNNMTSPDIGISRSAAGVLAIGNATQGDSSGAIAAKSKAGAFAAGDVPSGAWLLGRDTTNSTTKLYYNNAGTLMVAALA